MRKKEKTTERGFSLIELLLVISFISILGVMTTAFSARFLTQNAIANTADVLVNDFRKAQMNAMMGKQNSNWGVNFSSSTNMITLYRGTVLGTPDHAFDEMFSVNSGVSVNSHVSFDINFTRSTGVPNTTIVITLLGAGETRTVTINNQGVVTR